MMKRQFWTEAEKEILKSMAMANRCAKDIIKVLKSRTIHSVNQKAAELGLSLAGKEPEIDINEFNRLMGINNGSNRSKDNPIRERGRRV